MESPVTTTLWVESTAESLAEELKKSMKLGLLTRPNVEKKSLARRGTTRKKLVQFFLLVFFALPSGLVFGTRDQKA